MTKEIKTKKEAEALGFIIYIFTNGDWTYKDNEGHWHLFRNNEELLPEIKKLRAHSYANEYWDYEDDEGYTHFFRNDKELLPEIKKLNIFPHPNGNWEYKDINEEWHIVKG